MIACKLSLDANHLSGEVKPSKEDIAITKRLIEVGKVVDIEVMDHFQAEGILTLVIYE
ncbi:MAG TPA: hypothetical protein ENN18_11670 [Proteobacteria bacterium]|nr:hypothetical protein [Pseudomonadota bacterium]